MRHLAIHAPDPTFTGVVEGIAFDAGLAWVHAADDLPALARLHELGFRIVDRDAPEPDPEPEPSDEDTDTDTDSEELD